MKSDKLKYIGISSAVLLILCFFELPRVFQLIQKNNLINDSIADVKQDSLYCDCNKKMAYENIKLGNLTGYYNISGFNTVIIREYAMVNYNVEIVGYNDDTKLMCDKTIMDSVIKVRFGSNFFEMLQNKGDSIVLARKAFDARAKLGSYTDVSPGLIYNVKDRDKLYAYLSSELKRSFPNSLIQPPCHPFRLQFSVLVRKDGSIGDLQITKKLTSNINERLAELIKSYPYKWIPAKIEGNIVEFRHEMYLFFGEGNPYKKLIE